MRVELLSENEALSFSDGTVSAHSNELGLG